MKMHLIVVNYFSSQHVASLLDSLIDQDLHTITIVDNSGDHAERIALADIVGDGSIVRCDNNPGYGEAVNRGIASVHANPDDAFLILNPDTRVIGHDFIETMKAELRLGVDVVVPLVSTGLFETRLVWAAGGTLDMKRGETWLAGWGESVQGLDRSRFRGPVDFVSGAAFALRADVWTRLGGFRNDLFMYWEDADFSARARNMSLRVTCEPNAEVWHLVGGTHGSSGKSNLYYYYMQRNRIVICSDSRPVRFIVGPGRSTTIRLMWRSFREKESRLDRVRWSLLGVWDGIWSARSNQLRDSFRSTR